MNSGGTSLVDLPLAPRQMSSCSCMIYLDQTAQSNSTSENVPLIMSEVQV